MKALLALCIASALAVAGCGGKSDQATATTNAPGSDGSLATAPVDYLKSAANAKQSAVKTIDTTSLEKAIQLFNVGEGRNPKDLNELVEKKYIPEMPNPPYGTKLVYDPAAGTVKVVSQ